MSKDETTQPTPRINIVDNKSPNPPWTNKYFDCECGAHYQLGCADELEPVQDRFGAYFTQPCWTCGRVNIVTIPADDVTLQRFNDSTQEANPS